MVALSGWEKAASIDRFKGVDSLAVQLAITGELAALLARLHLDQPTFSQADCFCTTDYQVIQQPDIYRVQGVTQAIGQDDICLAGFGITAGMVVRDDDRCSVGVEHRLDYLPGIDAGTVQGAVEQPLEGQYTMLVVQQDHAEHLPFLGGQLRCQIAPDQRWAGQVVAAFEALFENGLSPIEHVVLGQTQSGHGMIDLVHVVYPDAVVSLAGWFCCR